MYEAVFYISRFVRIKLTFKIICDRLKLKILELDIIAIYFEGVEKFEY